METCNIKIPKVLDLSGILSLIKFNVGKIIQVKKLEDLKTIIPYSLEVISGKNIVMTNRNTLDYRSLTTEEFKKEFQNSLWELATVMY